MRLCLFSPFRVVHRNEEVAYELEFLEGRKSHSVYHVSCLQRAWGPQVTTTNELPLPDERGCMLLNPKEIMDVWERILRSRVIREYRVRWRDLLVEDATWDNTYLRSKMRCT
jgi:hypothetical protein